jgi:tetratricopeptide (TPR) repeat protein
LKQDLEATSGELVQHREVLTEREAAQKDDFAKFQELEEMLAAVKMERDELQRDLEVESERSSGLYQQLQELSASVEEGQEVKGILESKIAELEEERQRAEQLGQEVQEFRQALEQIQDEKGHLEMKTGELEGERERAEEMQQHIQELTQNLEQTQEDKGHLELTVKELEAAQSETRDQLELLLSEREGFNSQIGEINIDLERYRSEIEELNKTILDMNEDKEQFSEKFERKLEEFRKVDDSTKVVEDLIEKGITLYENEAYQEAIDAWEQAMQRDPDNRKVAGALSFVKEKIGQLEDVTRLQEDEKLIEMAFQEGQTYFTQGDYTNAVEAWKQILRFKPDHKETIEAINYARDLISKSMMPVTEPVMETRPVAAVGQEQPMMSQEEMIESTIYRPYDIVEGEAEEEIQPPVEEEMPPTYTTEEIPVEEAVEEFVEEEIPPPIEEEVIPTQPPEEEEEFFEEIPEEEEFFEEVPEEEEEPVEETPSTVFDQITTPLGDKPPQIEEEISGEEAKDMMMAPPELEEEAVQDEVPTVAPEDVGDLETEIRTLIASEKYAMAEEMIEKMLEQDQSDPTGWVLIGEVYLNQERLKEADIFYQKALNLVADHSQALMGMGLVAQYKGNNALALDYFEKAIVADPGNADAVGFKGVTFFTEQRYEMALQDFERSLELKPGNIDILTLKGHTLMAMGNDEWALRIFEDVLELDPQNDEGIRWTQELRSRTATGGGGMTLRF